MYCMPTDCISYQNSGYFTPLIVDYLNQQENLRSLYNNFPILENFKNQIQQKSENFPTENRAILADVLHNQYTGFEVSNATLNNIDQLRSNTTFTVTTGHQLNLFSGPLYYLYKIISTIKLADTLKSAYSENDFVPIFWMATEDHDFEEINHFHYKDRKISWNTENFGPTGRILTDGLNLVLEEFRKELGISLNSKYVANLFENAYVKHKNLSEATRYLTNELFGKYGIVVIDADEKRLKKLFIPQMENDLFKNVAFQKVTETVAELEDYKIQVNPREINLFYIEDHLRERIIEIEGNYIVNNTDIIFTPDEIKIELQNFPEKFSPNVIMRPLYQEVILPNLCYIGGGGELAYWLELKSYFHSEKITFPALLLRNSVLISSQKQAAKLEKLEISWKELFLKQDELTTIQTQKLSAIPIDFTEQRDVLRLQFKALYEIAETTDKSFHGAVAAQEHKQMKGLDNLEKRLLKAQKRKFIDQLNRITNIQDELFPNGSLQERRFNFSAFYEDYGDNLVEGLMQQLNPLNNKFDIVIL